MIKTCKFCGIEFQTNQPYARFCSVACKNKFHFKKYSHDEHYKKYTYVCDYCKKSFDTNTIYKKYCSPECRYAATLELPHGGALKVKRCRTCGKEFKTNSTRKFFCCLACRNEHEAKRYGKDKKKGFVRICPSCGAEYVIVRATKNSHLCPKCRVLLRSAESSKSPEGLGLSARRCHDCGKPTTQYRCPSCHRKWAARHQVALCWDGLEEFAEYGGSL